jgi:hypothetical protein
MGLIAGKLDDDTIQALAAYCQQAGSAATKAE